MDRRRRDLEVALHIRLAAMSRGDASQAGKRMGGAGRRRSRLPGHRFPPEGPGLDATRAAGPSKENKGDQPQAVTISWRDYRTIGTLPMPNDCNKLAGDDPTRAPVACPALRCARGRPILRQDAGDRRRLDRCGARGGRPRRREALRPGDFPEAVAQRQYPRRRGRAPRQARGGTLLVGHRPALRQRRSRCRPLHAHHEARHAVDLQERDRAAGRHRLGRRQIPRARRPS